MPIFREQRGGARGRRRGRGRGVLRTLHLRDPELPLTHLTPTTHCLPVRTSTQPLLLGVLRGVYAGWYPSPAYDLGGPQTRVLHAMTCHANLTHAKSYILRAVPTLAQPSSSVQPDKQNLLQLLIEGITVHGNLRWLPSGSSALAGQRKNQ